MILLRIFTYLVAIVMVLPIVITGMLAFSSAQNVAFPPPGYSTRWIEAIFHDSYLMAAMGRSFTLALFTSVTAILICLPCCFFLERGMARNREGAEALMTAPRMIPEIVLALALLIYYERMRIAETPAGLAIAHLLICIPFAFRTMAVSVGTLDRRLEWSSDILGASAGRGFFKVVLPQLKTALISAFVFTFVLSFNDVTMALFLSPVGQRTLPVEMFTRMYIGGMNPIIPAISFLLAIGGLVAFIVLDRTIGAFNYLSGTR